MTLWVPQIFMGTFILAFVGNSFVHSALQSAQVLPVSPKWRRRCLVLLYFTILVSIVTLFGVLTIPDIIREGADFVSRLQSDNIWTVVLEKLRHGVGCAPCISTVLCCSVSSTRVGSTRMLPFGCRPAEQLNHLAATVG